MHPAEIAGHLADTLVVVEPNCQPVPLVKLTIDAW